MVIRRAKKWQIKLFTKQTPTTAESGLNLLKKYEEMIGLVEVQEAQRKVLQCEKGLLESMQERRVVAEKLLDIQRRIKVGKDRKWVFKSKEELLPSSAPAPV